MSEEEFWQVAYLITLWRKGEVALLSPATEAERAVDSFIRYRDSIMTDEEVDKVWEGMHD